MNAFRVLVASLAALAVLGAVAWVDHERKGAAMHEASEDQWYCRHRGIRCGRKGPAAVERGWQRRERVYEVMFVAVAVVGAGAAASRVSRGRN